MPNFGLNMPDFTAYTIQCPNDRINIIQATYGGQDRTRVVKALCQNSPSCTIKVAPQEDGGSLGPGDPAPGVQKTLALTGNCVGTTNPNLIPARFDEVPSSSFLGGWWWLLLALIVIVVLILLYKNRKCL